MGIKALGICELTVANLVPFPPAKITAVEMALCGELRESRVDEKFID